MMKLIGKTFKIVETEIYNNKALAFLANMCILILVLCLQTGDITLKITGNYIIILWIAVNVCFLFHTFLKSNREFILYISNLKNSSRYFFLLSLAIVFNAHWFLVIFLQLVLCFHSGIGNALLITFVQYLYAVALGAFCGMIQKKGLGLLLLGVFGVYNFVFCNPYNYEASSHLFIISEPVFTVNNLNTESVLNVLFFALFFGAMAFLGMRLSINRRMRSVLLGISGFVLIYAIFIVYTISGYQKSNAEEYVVYDQQDRMEYKGLSEKEIKAVAEILFIFEDEYKKIEDNKQMDIQYSIQKKYLPEIVWLINGGSLPSIQISDHNVEVNILAPNMLYFENPDLLKAFLEEIELEMEVNVSGYRNSKYTRHVISGYGMCILKNVSENLEIATADVVHNYYQEYYDEMFVLPTTEYNFVKKIAYVVYDKYPEYIYELYSSVMDNEIANDNEFINLLKYDFEEIYEDNEIENIISNIE